MKSELPKVLHTIVGLPMVEHVVRAMRGAGIERVVVVIGHNGEAVQKALGDSCEYAWQREQLGTGHAVLMARDLLKDHRGAVVIATGDAPLVQPDVFQRVLSEHVGFDCTVAGAVLDDPSGYGRIVRDEAGLPNRIVESKDCRPDQALIKEVNAGIYVFEGPLLFKHLPGLKNSNASGEYYLTDLVEAVYRASRKVNAIIFDDASLVTGVNDRWQLAEAESVLKLRILKRHALNGVTIRDPASCTVGPDVEIGPDCVIEAGAHLLGKTKIGSGCRLGPFSWIDNCEIGNDSHALYAHMAGVKIGNGVKCGPFANLRPGTVLGDGVKVGNFVEVKNSVLGDNASASHLAYLGDSDIGSGTNIGAGTITCNFDGVQKHRTTIGADVFVGSNSTLVAPVELGDRSLIAAGSTITQNVPADAGAFGRARQETKPDWAAKKKEQRKSQS